MTTTILHYYGVCERLNDSFWAEPLNALTNMAFLIVGLALIRFERSRADMLKGHFVWDIRLLTGLIFCIGIASFTFHTQPTPKTELADVVFIVAFIVVYFISAIRRVTRCTWFETGIALMAFVGFTHMSVTQFPNALNDSIGYLSSMTALCVIAFYLNSKRRRSARQFLFAALIGVISLFCRGIDNAVCDVLPMGTHFLWHSLNALLVYVIMIQLIRNVGVDLPKKKRDRSLHLENA